MSQPIQHGISSFADKPVFSINLNRIEDFPNRLDLGARFFICFVAMNAKVLSDEQIQKLANRLLESGCTYFCFWGPDCERVHDLADLADLANHPEGPWAMTTWHSKEPLHNALWFALNSAWPDPAFEDEPHAVLALTIGSNRWAKKVQRALGDISAFTKNEYTNVGTLSCRFKTFVDAHF